MKNARPQLWKRALASVLTLQLALAPVEPALAQLTKLADEPIGFSPQAAPNIVMTVDDSTSMLADFLPDYVISGVPGAAPAVGGFCRDANGLMTVPCGFVGSSTTPPYIYSAGNTTGGTTVPYPRYAVGSPIAYSNSSIPDWLRAWPAPAHNNALNRIYYDPSITYTPPSKYDGTPYPSQDKATTVSWTKVVTDPWVPPLLLRYENLTATVKVGMWCNSDWPNNVDPDPTITGGLGGGNECRINGTNYAGVAPTDPAVSYTDYIYPWQKTAGVKDPKYFVIGAAGLNNTWAKTLWCDTTHAKYPKTCTTPMVCPVAPVPPPPVAQTCFFQGNQTGCVIPASFSPAGCNANVVGTKYGAPGCTGANCCTGSECLVCNVIPCTMGTTGRLGRCRLASTVAPGSGGSNAACNCTGIGCSLPACPNYTPPATCPVALVPGTPSCNNVAGACTQKLHDPATKTNIGITMQADANGLGEVCRRNNQSYGGGPAAGLFNFPSGKFVTPVTASCPTVDGYSSIPRHYWKVSVEWCTAKITANNDKWRGFGLFGSCQDEHDLAHPYPRFYKWGVRKIDPEYLDNYLYSAFERVDLGPTTATFTHVYYNSLGVQVTIPRSYDAEMENYANWFAYYRTRVQAAKTVISQNFTFLDDTYRVGFHTLNNIPPTSWVNVKEFDNLPGGQKDVWYQKLFGIQIAMGQQTPNIDAVVRIGELFKNGTNASLLGATDPIILSCQKNYHMLFTDGITNQSSMPAFAPGNVDNIVPALPVPLSVLPPIVAAAPWPDLYREDTGASLANTMSDYATYYWVTDLRPAMTNNVVTGRDPASWQHMNFAALSLGAEGVLAGASPATVESQIAAGTAKWPTPAPTQNQPNATGVDDLWHAAVNGRGRFVNAKTSQQLGRGIASILQDISSPSGSASPPTFANPNLSVTNNFTFVAKFEQGWGGTVQKILVNPLTGAAVPGPPVWDAKTQLIAQTTPTIPDPQPWFTKRRIVSVNDTGAFVPFTFAGLGVGSTNLGTLGVNLAYQKRVIEYLRGNRAEEGDLDNQFRIRPSPLGDIVDSQGVLVGPTDPPPVGMSDYWDYLDANDPGYSVYKTSQATRAARIYIGANDGMLHAFDATTGDEAWAFIPSDFYRSAPPISNDKAGLIGLTYQPGGLPIYDHRFYVNATPRIVDAVLGGAWSVATEKTVGGTWATLLVGGLGKGGKSYFAIDASNPGTVADEATAASKVKWEFRDATDLGYTYGRATIVKTRAFGWTVIVPSGYNNASGVGKLFFLDPNTGLPHRPPLSTNVGTAVNPSGLAHIAGYTKDFRNQVVEQVYGGDLLGNLWRFDLSSSNSALWKAELFAVVTDAGGVRQPITSPPRIDIDVANGVDRWVFVGTGKLTHACDLTNYYAANIAAGEPCVGNPDPNQVQTMYAIRDGTYTTPLVIPPGPPLVTRTDLDDVSNSGIAGLGANVIASKGWFDDLNNQVDPVSGLAVPNGRIIRTPVAAVGLIAYLATSEPLDPCEVGLPASIYVRQFGNGESRLTDTSGNPLLMIYEPTGAAGMEVIATNPPGCTANCIPDIKLAILSSSTSQLLTFNAKLPSIVGERRMSWGTLNTQ